jgi:hypothetical protein
MDHNGKADIHPVASLRGLDALNAPLDHTQRMIAPQKAQLEVEPVSTSTRRISEMLD